MKRIITITAPSLAGKTTLMRFLQQRFHGIHEVVSHTTRDPRRGEVHGRDYFFVSDDEFSSIEMVESVMVNDKKYGAAKKTFDLAFETGRLPIIITEPHGTAEIRSFAREVGWDHKAVFIATPLETRLGRFCHRLAGDRDGDVTAYTKRLLSMISDERDWHFMFPYDLVLNPRDALHPEKIIVKFEDLFGEKAIEPCDTNARACG